MIRRPPRSTRLTHSFPTRRSSDLAGWDFVNNASNFTIDAASGQIDVTRGKNDRYTAEYSAKFNAGWGPLTYVEAGVQFERVEFQSRLARSQFGGNVPIGALPLTLVPNDLSRIGVTGSRIVVIGEHSPRDFEIGRANVRNTDTHAHLVCRR